MVEELGSILPIVVQPVDVCDGQARELLLRDTRKAAEIYPVHFSDGRFSSDAEWSDTTTFAEVVLILLRVKQVLSEFRFSLEKPEATFFCHSRPEAVAPAYGAIAAVCALFKVEIGLERDRSAMAATLVSFQHISASK